MEQSLNLLVFNLKTDADDDVLGFTTDWINVLAARCQRVFVITMTAGRLDVADNVTVLSVGRERGYSEARRAVRFYRLLASVLRNQNVDACFAHMMPLFTAMGWPLLARRNVPIALWYAHSSVSMILRVATRAADRVLTSSPGGFRLPTPKLRIIGQGIDTERFRSQPGYEERGVLKVLTVGRIAPIKNVHLLIRAVALLRVSAPDRPVRVRIVGSPLTRGDQRYLASLRSEIAGLGLEGSVEVSEARPFHEIEREYRTADLFVNSSDTDSVDKTVLEAMSCELPIITSNAAFGDVLGPELAAECLIPKHDVEALRDRIAEMAALSPQGRGALGRALREVVVRDHSLDALADRIMEEIRGISDEQV